MNNKIRDLNFSPLLDYVLGLCNVMDVKKLVSSHSNPPVRGSVTSTWPYRDLWKRQKMKILIVF